VSKTQYVIRKSTIDSGGQSNLTGGAYVLGGTVGQHDAGELSGGAYLLTGGFWSPTAPGTACTTAAPAIADSILSCAPATVPSFKNRFLSFSGGDPGLSQAVRVTIVSLPGSFSVFNGTSAWVALPQPASELPSKALTEPVGTEASFMAAKLSPTPVYADWSTFGVVHVYDERIIPSRRRPSMPVEPAIYDIQVVTDGCDLNLAGSYSVPLNITNARWGDLAQLCNGQFRAPEGVVTVDDTLAMLGKFGNSPGAPIKARAELLGIGESGPVAAVDGKITVSDLLEVLNAFGGGEYPFAPPP